MKQFSLKRIIITNFRSLKEVCIDFDSSTGLKLIVGENKLEPRLGANGVGKSSILDSICWNLYGTGVKGAKVSSLLSWNEKRAEVLTEFFVNNELHTIYRSGPPVKMELDGVEKTQVEIDEFLGLTKERFLHSVIFGQGAPLFPDLTIPERAELLDTVLQLDVWNKASKTATTKCSELDTQILVKKSDLSYTEGQLSQLQSEQYIQAQIEYWDESQELEIKALQKQSDSWEATKTQDLAILQKSKDDWVQSKEEELKSYLSDISNFQSELELRKAQVESVPSVDTVQIEGKVKQNESLLTSLRKEYTEKDTERRLKTGPREFWIRNTVCPTCLQSITEEQKSDNLLIIDQDEQRLTSELDLLTTKIEQTKVDTEQSKLALRFLVSTSAANQELKKNLAIDVKQLETKIKGSLSSAERIGAELDKDSNPYSGQYAKLKKEENPYKLQVLSLKKKVNPFRDLLVKNKQERQTLESKRQQQSSEIKRVQQTLVSTEYWKQGFKRIRLFFVNQILAALEIEVQSAMESLGLQGWSVKLTTESVTKSETIKLGIQIIISSPTSEAEWSSWSGGESQRLRLAIEMGLASLIQRASGCFWSLEAWDEPGQHLSEQGVEDLLEVLKYRAASLNKSIFVTHHSALIYSGFSEVWKVTKDSHGSSINCLQENNYVTAE